MITGSEAAVVVRVVKGREGDDRSRTGGLAQLARAPALQAGGHRFDSDILHQNGR